GCSWKCNHKLLHVEIPLFLFQWRFIFLPALLSRLFLPLLLDSVEYYCILLLC
ncbi:hypothetical protein RYX36_012589, partial [Vicia faba]